MVCSKYIYETKFGFDITHQFIFVSLIIDKSLNKYVLRITKKNSATKMKKQLVHTTKRDEGINKWIVPITFRVSSYFHFYAITK